jgi:hypothetical protein
MANLVANELKLPRASKEQRHEAVELPETRQANI